MKNIHKGILKHIDGSACTSQYTAKNFSKIYNIKTKVIYPPFGNIKEFYWEEPEDYYLTVSRLESIKRIDLIIKAFINMPDKKLIIVGSGSQYRY